MIDFFIALGNFLKQSGSGMPPRNNMGYLTGSMERNVVLTIAVEEFEIPLTVVNNTMKDPFPDLRILFSTLAGTCLPNGPYIYPASGYQASNPDRRTLRLDRYRPVDSVVFRNQDYVWSTTPQEKETWLPHGVYRYWDETGVHLALFIANPWGVIHRGMNSQGIFVDRPMNPFTFNFLNPPTGMPPGNNYSYTFTFDPTKYGITAQYSVERRDFDQDGNPVGLPVSYGNFTSSFTPNPIPSLQQGRFQAFYFDVGGP